MVWPATADVDRFDEAVDFFRDRVPTIEEPDPRDPTDRYRSFRVAGAMELEVTQAVHGEILDAIETGRGFDEFKARVREKLQAWRASPYQVETTFRTHVQTAYNTGRYQQLTHPENTASRPLLMYDATLDSRTTEICRNRDGMILPHDDPRVQENWCPCHYRCRSTWRSLTRKQAERRGGQTMEVPDPPPDEGFGLSPPRRGETLPEPKRSRFDPELWSAYIDRRRQLDQHARTPLP